MIARLLDGLALLAAGLAAIWLALVPYDTATGGWPAPDLVFVLVAAWTIRRPAGAPLWEVVALGLAADILLSRPVGLGAAALLLSVEALRARAASPRAGRFPAEWAVVAAVGAVALLAMNGALAMVFLDPLPLGVLARQAAATALAYPLAAGALALAPGRALSTAMGGRRRP